MVGIRITANYSINHTRRPANDNSTDTMSALNKYRQRPVEREPEEKQEEWKPSIPKPFEEGEMVRCHFLPLFYTIPEPAKAVKVEAFKRCMSGWMVTVLDTEGRERQLDSKYFSKHKG